MYRNQKPENQKTAVGFALKNKMPSVLQELLTAMHENLPSTKALNDINNAIGYYLTEAGQAVSLASVDALEDVFRKTGIQPKSSSPHSTRELDIPGLRFRTVGRFPR